MRRGEALRSNKGSPRTGQIPEHTFVEGVADSGAFSRLELGGAGRARRWPEGAAGDQEHGRRKRRAPAGFARQPVKAWPRGLPIRSLTSPHDPIISNGRRSPQANFNTRRDGAAHQSARSSHGVQLRIQALSSPIRADPTPARTTRTSLCWRGMILYLRRGAHSLPGPDDFRPSRRSAPRHVVDKSCIQPVYVLAISLKKAPTLSMIIFLSLSSVAT
jgi:hypothetical protein